MSQNYLYTLNGVVRNDQGKGASRRLRREGWVPAIVYGAEKAPLSIAIKQDELLKNAKHDSFFSQIINLKLEGQSDTEILVRDVQHHAYKPLFMHFDFQRIVRGQELEATVAIHFINEENAKGVKAGGVLTRALTSIDIYCRPSKLPEFIEIDLATLDIGESLHLSDVTLPEGVKFCWSQEDLENTMVAQITHARNGSDDGDSEDEDSEK